MLQHCIDKMSEAGITDILIVTGGEHLGEIAEYCGSGYEFGCTFTYKVQDEAGGIAQALALAEGFVRPGERMCVILGDNIFEDSLIESRVQYERSGKEAWVVLQEVEDPERFGVAEVADGDAGKVLSIEEKPDKPKSNLAVTGIYFYDYSVFGVIRTLKPSGRGELEITDVNNHYVRSNSMGCSYWHGWWSDAGTHDSYRKANELYGWGKQ
jgi:glucose-1-phosphate thymidylyltransferase